MIPLFTIESTDFDTAWARAVSNCLKGPEILFGDAKNPKTAKDTIQTISLTGNAIRQIERKEIHPLYPFKQIKQYCEEFTTRYLIEYRKKPEAEKFSYLYFDRLCAQIPYLESGLRHQIHDRIPSNRDQIITWIPGQDLCNPASPCLQRIWLRHNGDLTVDVHFHWRSRDCYCAWQSNIIALVDMLYREVLDPNDCIIGRIVDFNDSLHVYKADWDAASKVVPNPFMEGR